MTRLHRCLIVTVCSAALIGCVHKPVRQPRILSSHAPAGAPLAPPLRSSRPIVVPSAPVAPPAVAQPVVVAPAIEAAPVQQYLPAVPAQPLLAAPPVAVAQPAPLVPAAPPASVAPPAQMVPGERPPRPLPRPAAPAYNEDDHYDNRRLVPPAPPSST